MNRARARNERFAGMPIPWPEVLVVFHDQWNRGLFAQAPQRPANSHDGIAARELFAGIRPDAPAPERSDVFVLVVIAGPSGHLNLNTPADAVARIDSSDGQRFRHDATAVSSSTGNSTSGFTRRAFDNLATVSQVGE